MRPLIALIGIVMFAGCVEDKVPEFTFSPRPTVIHPVFHTPVTGTSSRRPAIQVDIKDDSEDVFFRAELYLGVQSSRFPGGTTVILPLNLDSFAGCRSRYVQLPFEVTPNDVLLFNLLDDDTLTAEQERLVLNSCQSSGYCLLIAGEIYCPPAATIAGPMIPDTSAMLGNAILQDVSIHHFENFGTAEFIVPTGLPCEPYRANELSIRNSSNYVPAVIKLFGPKHEVPFMGNPAKT